MNPRTLPSFCGRRTNFTLNRCPPDLRNVTSNDDGTYVIPCLRRASKRFPTNHFAFSTTRFSEDNYAALNSQWLRSQEIRFKQPQKKAFLAMR